MVALIQNIKKLDLQNKFIENDKYSGYKRVILPQL